MNSNRIVALGFGALTMIAVAAWNSAGAGDDGRLDWVVRYNGPGNAEDIAWKMATSPDGAIYVTGSTYHPGPHDYHLFVNKYNAAGKRFWSHVVQTSLTPHGPTGLAVDSEGNAVVSGATWSGAAWQLSIWKFDRQSGQVLWERHHAEAGGQCLVHEISAAALAIDHEDNVVVAGCGMTVIKYDSAGNLLWQRSGAPAELGATTDIALGPDGSVHVAGISYPSFDDFGVVVYDADGNHRFDDVLTGPIGAVLGGTFVDVAPFGETVIGGTPETTCGLFSLGLVSYDEAGQQQWSLLYPENPCNTFTPAGIAIDSTGAIYSAGSLGGSSDIATARFDRFGNLEWERTHDGPAGSSDRGLGLAIDDQDNVYVVGEQLFQPPQNRDAVALKYKPSGELAWVAPFAGPTGGNDRGHAIAVDECGRVFFAGYGWNPPFGSDAFLARVSQPSLPCPLGR